MLLAQPLRQQDQVDKNQDNQEFSDRLSRERKADPGSLVQCSTAFASSSIAESYTIFKTVE
ncbi:10436_t:CDS:2 [Gigaspora margarita]|uniref:10436_t:CDS:1 n=1 Tax=Gigaspora margarita TaxID=4874 RepID=A0ABN7UVP0_GIGMA|nr:10436_t:CDS:2 [Gigaspora margarita]